MREQHVLRITTPYRARARQGRHIHDYVSHLDEQISRLCLSKKVGQVIASSHVRDTQLVFLDTLAHEEVSSVDMLHAPEVLRVVRHLDP